MAIRLQGTAIDLAVWSPPTRNSINKDGEPVIEKLPTQRSRYMLNPAGHGVWMALHCGSGNRNPNDPIALRIYDEKTREGFLPFDRCPQTLEPDIAQRHLPPAVRSRAACGVGSDGKSQISNANPCKCLIETMGIRAKANSKLMAEVEKRYTSKDDRERQQRDRQIEALEKQNAQLATKERARP